MRAAKALVAASAVLALSLLVSHQLQAPQEEEVDDSIALLQGKTSVTSGSMTETKSTSVASLLGDGKLDMQACAAEFVAMTLFVTISCGSAMSVAKTDGSAWILQVSLTFGLCITALAYSIGHISGGQINCAVTFGLVLLNKLSVAQGAANLAAQLLGSIFGAFILSAIYNEEKDKTGGLATNKVADGFTQSQALVAEIVGTFLLMFVVLETATDPGTSANRALACLAIGFAVFLAHSMLISIDGCSINPTRTFGPALVAKFRYKADVRSFDDMWVFWAGPLIGAALAAGVYKSMSA